VIPEFHWGTSGREVLLLQRMLRRLGYYTGNDDGVVGPLTWKAVAAFQADMGLTRSIWPDPETLFWLFAMAGGKALSEQEAR